MSQYILSLTVSSLFNSGIVDYEATQQRVAQALPPPPLMQSTQLEPQAVHRAAHASPPPLAIHLLHPLDGFGPGGGGGLGLGCGRGAGGGGCGACLQEASLHDLHLGLPAPVIKLHRIPNHTAIGQCESEQNMNSTVFEHRSTGSTHPRPARALRKDCFRGTLLL